MIDARTGHGRRGRGRARRRRQRQRGFTLLEVLIALAILAVGLVWLIEATSQAIILENHAKLEATATFLARQRLVELEDELGEKGFTDDSFAKETSGDFDDKGFKRFRWTAVLDKVVLPAGDQVQSMVSKAVQAKGQLGGGAGGDPFAAPQQAAPTTGGGATGTAAQAGGAGMMQTFFPIVKDVLEQGIRRAHVTVGWNELGKPRNVEIYEYLTDPRRVDMALQLGIPGAGGVAGGPSANGGTTTTTGGITTTTNGSTTTSTPNLGFGSPRP